MTTIRIRTGLYLERVAVAFASGIFLILPLYFKGHGETEIFFGKVYAIGAVSTLMCVALGSFFMKALGLSRIAPTGSLFYGMGCFLYFIAERYHASSFLYYAASLLQGAGWGLVFTMGPICLSTTLDSTNRAYYFTIYAAYSTLGVGIGPIIVQYVTVSLGWSYQYVFLLGTAASLLGFLVSVFTSKNNTFYKTVSGGTSEGNAKQSLLSFTVAVELKEFLLLVQQPTVYFFAMVLLGACVYTSMINLQTTLAQSFGINYTIFYFFYSLAVVGSRFFLSKRIATFPSKYSINGLLLLMACALILLLWADRSLVAYSIGSLLLGISYGLVYPLVQAQAANHAPSHLRPQALIYFSLFYFLAVYMFPYVGAKIAVDYGYSVLLLTLILISILELLVGLFFFYGRVCANNPEALRAEK